MGVFSSLKLKKKIMLMEVYHKAYVKYNKSGYWTEFSYIPYGVYG